VASWCSPYRGRSHRLSAFSYRPSPVGAATQPKA